MTSTLTTTALTELAQALLQHPLEDVQAAVERVEKRARERKNGRQFSFDRRIIIMDEKQMRQIMYASVSLACNALTDLELAQLNLAVQLNGDATTTDAYPKIKHLFDKSNGTKMHEETMRALGHVADVRLTKALAQRADMLEIDREIFKAAEAFNGALETATKNKL